MQDYKFNNYKPAAQTIEEVITMQLLVKNLMLPASSVLKLDSSFLEPMLLFLSGVHSSKSSAVKVCMRRLYLCSISRVHTQAC